MAKTKAEILLIVRKFADGILAKAAQAIAPDSEKLEGRTYSEVLQNATGEPVLVLTGQTGTVVLDYAQARVFDVTATGTVVFELLNAPVSPERRVQLTLVLRRGTGDPLEVTWFDGALWIYPHDASEPPLPAEGQIVEYVFTSNDGVSWLGRAPV